MTTDKLSNIVAINGAIQAAIVSLLLESGGLDRAKLSKRLAAIEREQTTAEQRAAAAMSVGLLRSYLSLPS